MAHQLAEAICELAAPGLEPCFIRVQIDQSESKLATAPGLLAQREAAAEACVHGAVLPPY